METSQLIWNTNQLTGFYMVSGVFTEGYFQADYDYDFLYMYFPSTFTTTVEHLQCRIGFYNTANFPEDVLMTTSKNVYFGVQRLCQCYGRVPHFYSNN